MPSTGVVPLALHRRCSVTACLRAVTAVPLGRAAGDRSIVHRCVNAMRQQLQTCSPLHLLAKAPTGTVTPPRTHRSGLLRVLQPRAPPMQFFDMHAEVTWVHAEPASCTGILQPRVVHPTRCPVPHSVSRTPARTFGLDLWLDVHASLAGGKLQLYGQQSSSRQGWSHSRTAAKQPTQRPEHHPLNLCVEHCGAWRCRRRGECGCQCPICEVVPSKQQAGRAPLSQSPGPTASIVK